MKTKCITKEIQDALDRDRNFTKVEPNTLVLGRREIDLLVRWKVNQDLKRPNIGRVFFNAPLIYFGMKVVHSERSSEIRASYLYENDSTNPLKLITDAPISKTRIDGQQ